MINARSVRISRITVEMDLQCTSEDRSPDVCWRWISVGTKEEVHKIINPRRDVPRDVWKNIKCPSPELPVRSSPEVHIAPREISPGARKDDFFYMHGLTFIKEMSTYFEAWHQREQAKLISFGSHKLPYYFWTCLREEKHDFLLSIFVKTPKNGLQQNQHVRHVHLSRTGSQFKRRIPDVIKGLPH